MKKYSLVVEILSEKEQDLVSIRHRISEAVGIVGSYQAVKIEKVVDMTEQGVKVWAKKVGGFSLALHKEKVTN